MRVSVHHCEIMVAPGSNCTSKRSRAPNHPSVPKPLLSRGRKLDCWRFGRRNNRALFCQFLIHSY